MISVTNTGSLSGVSIEDLQANLRMPAGLDELLLQTLLDAAVEQVEQSTGRAIISKSVVQKFIGWQPMYYLKYKATGTVDVTIDDVEATDTQIIKDVAPSIVIINDTMTEANPIITIAYTTEGELTKSLKGVVLIIASMMYNNPEGLGAIDQARINNILNQNLIGII